MKRPSHLLLIILLTCDVSYAQVKSVAERLGYPPNSKLLIILADDVGVYHAANLASFTALNQRAVTSGTVMQTSPWLTEVAAYAKQHPDISLGVHLTLCSEYNTFRWGPVASKDQAPSLLDPTGYLFPHGSDTVSHAKPVEIERELRAQMDRAIQFGFNPDFVDSHQRALFSNEELFRLYMKIARDYKLPLKPGLHQFYVHLAFDDGEAAAISVDHTAYGAAWRQRDFNVMTSPEFKKALDENHIILVSWKDLKKITS